MNKYVIDANIAVKWVIPEIYSDLALRLKNPNYELLVPDFFSLKLLIFFGKK